MLIKRNSNGDLPLASEITPREIYESRRSFLKQIAATSVAGGALFEMATRQAFAQSSGAQKLVAKPNPAYVVMDNPTSRKDATTYNNFYEFGTSKPDKWQQGYSKQYALDDD